MTDTYYIDLSKISLDQFQQQLETQDLLPSRRILHEEIAARFKVLSTMGISNLQELFEALKTKKQLAQFAKDSGLPVEYLTILRREVNTNRPSPVNLKAFPGIDADCAKKLAETGIKNSRHLFDHTRTSDQQKALFQKTGIHPEALGELTGLSDLVRVSGVGPVFARMLYDLDIKSAADLAGAQSAPLFGRLMDLNKVKSYTRARFFEKDVDYCIELAKMLY